MTYLLNAIYVCLLAATAPWLAWRSYRTGRYRRGWAEKFWGNVPAPRSDRPLVWLHAVSLGEVNLLAPLVSELRRRRPGWELTVTTSTQTGYEQARVKFADLTVSYCPLDFSWAVRRTLRRWRPRLVVLAELELWPNLIRLAKEEGAAVAVINGRLSPRSFRGYRRLRPLVSGWLAQLDLVAAQSEEYAQRFRALGARPESVATTGSIKFDGAQTDRVNSQTAQLARLAGVKPGDMVFLAGSTQEPEEAFALQAFQSLQAEFPQLKLMIAPRHPERFDAVAQLLQRSGVAWRRRSSLVEGAENVDTRVLLLDSVGELRAWWGLAQAAFVGGSLSTRGGQNMIEPAAYGATVSFGPNTRNFREIVAQFLAADAAVVVHDQAELTSFVRRCLADRTWAEAVGQRAQRLVLAQQGATARTVDRLLPLVDDTLIAEHDGLRRRVA